MAGPLSQTKVVQAMPNRSEKQIRSLVRKVETRADGERMTVAGYAAIFGEVADIAGIYREVIARGAFSRSLRTDDVLALFGHDSGRLLGRTTSGTLRLAEDAKGLSVEIDLPDTTDGRDVLTLIARGDISGMSFGFNIVHEEWDFSVEPPLRTIIDVDLVEVSVVSAPAYAGTSIALRSLESARAEIEHRHFVPAIRLRMKVGLDLALRK